MMIREVENDGLLPEHGVMQEGEVENCAKSDAIEQALVQQLQTSIETVASNQPTGSENLPVVEPLSRGARDEKTNSSVDLDRT